MEQNTVNEQNTVTTPDTATKFCKFCGGKIPQDAVICTLCGRQVEEIKRAADEPSVVINNSNTNTNTNKVNAVTLGLVHPKNKWVAFLLCLFLGYIGAHKFYEGRIGLGILYLFTGGLFGLGWLIDCIILLCKPNPYYVK